MSPGTPKAILVWSFLFYVILQVGGNLFFMTRHPEVYDPEYSVRLKLLRATMSEEPSRPLLLLIGSSRTVMSFRPEILPPGQPALIFNFSHIASGPMMNLVMLRRLLADNIRPRWLVLEVMPPQLNDVKQGIVLDTMTARDVPVVRRYRGIWTTYLTYCLRRRVSPWYENRVSFMYCYFRDWLPETERPVNERLALGRLGGGSQWDAPGEISSEETHRRTAMARQTYYPPLQQFRVCSGSEQAVRETLDLCRQEHIETVLLLTPEGKEFQSWYSAAARAAVDRWCAALSDEYHVALIDARNWLDESNFFDSHHVVMKGANAFTRRLDQDVLHPLVEGAMTKMARAN